MIETKNAAIPDGVSIMMIGLALITLVAALVARGTKDQVLSCIDTTLHLVERSLGGEIASENTRILEYGRATRANASEFPIPLRQSELWKGIEE
jgi:hypothetical protein